MVHPQVHGRSFPHAECICILYINNKLTKGTEKPPFLNTVTNSDMPYQMLNVASNVLVFRIDIVSYTSLRIVRQHEWRKY